MPRPFLLRRRRFAGLIGSAGAAALLGTGGAAAARPLVYSDNPAARYICIEPDCSPYIYDPAVGDPDRGVAPGTPFAEVPDDWTCPDCDAPKWQFVPLD